jgi:hypothetical protein
MQVLLAVEVGTMGDEITAAGQRTAGVSESQKAVHNLRLRPALRCSQRACAAHADVIKIEDGKAC